MNSKIIFPSSSAYYPNVTLPHHKTSANLLIITSAHRVFNPFLTFEYVNTNTFAPLTNVMRRIFLFVLVSVLGVSAFAQSDSTTRKNLLNHKNTPRSGDHFMIQLGYLNWQGKPDSINTGGIPRTANVYFLFDFPFKTSPRWSAAIGAGIATDHMFFERTFVDIKGNAPALAFRNQRDTSHFKKFKLHTAYLEAPVELRFTANPDNNSRSFKAAIGAKVGTLLAASIKGKELEDRNGNTLNDYRMKEKSKRYFNTTRLSATARLGYGNFSLFGSYQVTPLFKEGVAAEIRPFSVGLNLSGL